MRTVLVTGSAGMIGSRLVEALLLEGYCVIGVDKSTASFNGHYEHHQIDLGNQDLLEELFNKKQIDRVIHLAALAHTPKGNKYPKAMFEYLNVKCAGNVFSVSEKHAVPVLFISTVDVYGFQKGVVDVQTTCHPVTVYGKTKYEAERALIGSKCTYSIYRLSPVYTETIKRDIQKRYYLKYPTWAYQIGNNSFYEVLDVSKAVAEMVAWCQTTPTNDIRIIKNEALLETKICIQEEKKCGRAKHVIRIPKWIALAGYYFLRITGKNKYTFLLSKALFPLKTK